MVRLKCLLFEETLARVLRVWKKNFLFYWRNRCSTGSSRSKADQRLTRVSFSFVKKTFLWIIFSVIFKSVQSVNLLANEAGSRVRFSPGAWKFSFSRAKMVSPLSKLKVFTGSVCVLLTSAWLKINKNKNKINLCNHEFVRKKKSDADSVLLFFLWSELIFFIIRVQFYFIFIFLFDPSRSQLILPGLVVRVDPVRLLYLRS